VAVVGREWEGQWSGKTTMQRECNTSQSRFDFGLHAVSARDAIDPKDMRPGPKFTLQQWMPSEASPDGRLPGR
jgi:hypothetical protein